MSRLGELVQRIPDVYRIGLGVVLGVGSMVLLMVWLAGGFTDKVQPRERDPLPPPPPGLTFYRVEEVEVPVVHELAGSIAAEHEVHAASELLGRVADVRVHAGQKVDAGQVLVVLEEAEQRAHLEQAEALLRQAEDHHRRIQQQHEAQAATESQLVQARSAWEAAQAQVAAARTVLAKTAIHAPSAGVVIERLCEVGDTVTPGAPVVRLYDRLQLVAIAPESLQPHLRVGQEVAVRVDAIGQGACAGQITEIVPQASGLTRAFQVKVAGSCAPGLIPGMFGRLRVPLGSRQELRVPKSAIRRVGQIPVVLRRLPDGALLRQFVQTGEELGDQVVILTGLRAGDQVVADTATLSLGEEP